VTNGFCVLSPHRDDAVFSLALTLTRGASRNIPLSIVNFFTRSDYAPRLSADVSVNRISAIRATEDQHVLRRISARMRLIDLDLLDAPLRRNIPASKVCFTAVCESEINLITAYPNRVHLSEFVFAPLGLGGHVDHVTVRETAIRSIRSSRLGFYEDLPYAMWTSERDLRRGVEDIEARTGMPLRPVIVTKPGGLIQKRDLVRGYRSQITAQETNLIARFSLKYRTGERLWLPASARSRLIRAMCS
jgi:LmbE family N-acetylglucosaminyl deacetylase